MGEGAFLSLEFPHDKQQKPFWLYSFKSSCSASINQPEELQAGGSCRFLMLYCLTD